MKMKAMILKGNEESGKELGFNTFHFIFLKFYQTILVVSLKNQRIQILDLYKIN